MLIELYTLFEVIAFALVVLSLLKFSTQRHWYLIILPFILFCVLAFSSLQIQKLECKQLLTESFEHYQYVNETAGTPQPMANNPLHNVTATNTYTNTCEVSNVKDSTMLWINFGMAIVCLMFFIIMLFVEYGVMKFQ